MRHPGRSSHVGCSYCTGLLASWRATPARLLRQWTWEQVLHTHFHRPQAPESVPLLCCRWNKETVRQSIFFKQTMDSMFYTWPLSLIQMPITIRLTADDWQSRRVESHWISGKHVIDVTTHSRSRGRENIDIQSRNCLNSAPVWNRL